MTSAHLDRGPELSRIGRIRELPPHLVGWRVIEARNACVTLRHEASGVTRACTDLVCGYGALNFGHRNPGLDPWTSLSLDLMPGFYTDAADAFAVWLCDELHLPHHRVLFQIGGSFAVSAALAFAQRRKPGRIRSVAGAFHGLGLDCLALAPGHERGTLFDTPLLDALRGRIEIVTPGDHPPSWDGVSCFIYETIQGSAGHIPLPVDWLSEMERAATSAGATTIADEILCGFFRHGWLSPARACGLAPDILLFSKSMTNGLFPYSAMVYPQAFEALLDDEVCAEHTFQASALGGAAALAVARYIDTGIPHADVTRLGTTFADAARDVAAAGIEIAHRTACTLSIRPPRSTEEVAARCFDDGVLVTICGRDDAYLCLVPPLTIETSRLTDAIDTVIRHAR